MDASQGPRPVLVFRTKAAAAQARARDTGGREAADGAPPADGGVPREAEVLVWGWALPQQPFPLNLTELTLQPAARQSHWPEKRGWKARRLRRPCSRPTVTQGSVRNVRGLDPRGPSFQGRMSLPPRNAGCCGPRGITCPEAVITFPLEAEDYWRPG